MPRGTTAWSSIDEAYREFVTGADVPDALELFGDRPNVAVLRTLSKAYGLAGLRVGFLVADPAVVDAVTPARSPSVSTPPPKPPLAALDQQATRSTVARRVTAERWRVAQALRRCGLGVPASEANFWWLPAGTSFSATLSLRSGAARGRHPAARGRHPRHVGVPVDNDRFLAALDAAVADEPELAGGSGKTTTGSSAVAAAEWLDRLGVTLGRFRAHLAVDHPGRTEPVPGEDETWDDRDVWAHVAEFGDYWLAS